MCGKRVNRDLRITPGFAVNREQSRSLPISRLLRTNSRIGEWVGDVPPTSIHRFVLDLRGVSSENRRLRIRAYSTEPPCHRTICPQ